ncbi:MAG TPA: type II toxin-antitoxin system RelE/ParE family toxin [Burkholderiaceae bacterium]|nr:type II toxin-antitoxin system RelE/ParE family toxin [Burkholderiaceae bacterium]
MLRLRLSAAAQADIVEILAWSEDQFGESARLRYEALIAAALRDIAEQPDRTGSIARPELGASVRSWHLRSSRDRARTDLGAVRRPRHFVIYRVESDLLIVGRVLHDAMELVRYLDPAASWE